VRRAGQRRRRRRGAWRELDAVAAAAIAAGRGLAARAAHDADDARGRRVDAVGVRLELGEQPLQRRGVVAARAAQRGDVDGRALLEAAVNGAQRAALRDEEVLLRWGFWGLGVGARGVGGAARAARRRRRACGRWLGVAVAN